MKTLVCILFVLCSTHSFGRELRGNVYGLAGVTAIHSDESYFGSGLDIGGGIGFMIHPRFEVELEIDRAASSREFGSGVRFEADSLMVGGNGKFYFSSGKIRPYIFAGLANTHLTMKSSFFPEQQFFERTDDLFTINWGGGIRYFVKPTISIRPEFRWSWNEESFINQLRGSVAISYHF